LKIVVLPLFGRPMMQISKILPCTAKYKLDETKLQETRSFVCKLVAIFFDML